MLRTVSYEDGTRESTYTVSPPWAHLKLATFFAVRFFCVFCVTSAVVVPCVREEQEENFTAELTCAIGSKFVWGM